MLKQQTLSSYDVLLLNSTNGEPKGLYFDVYLVKYVAIHFP